MTNAGEVMDLVQKCLDDWPYAATRVPDIMTRLEKIRELLKDQEPVEPIIMDHIVFGTSRKCSKCNRELFPAGKYCPHCGKAVKWE